MAVKKRPVYVAAKHSSNPNSKPPISKIESVSVTPNGRLRIEVKVGGPERSNKVQIYVPFEIIQENFDKLMKYYVDHVEKEVKKPWKFGYCWRLIL